MSDMIELFNDMKKIKKEKRETNRQSSGELLTAAGIQFESKNGGAHLVVNANGHNFDFWPGTGLWIMRGSTQRHRGVFSLMTMVQK